jgi:hypothetical protein
MNAHHSRLRLDRAAYGQRLLERLDRLVAASAQTKRLGDVGQAQRLVIAVLHRAQGSELTLEMRHCALEVAQESERTADVA